MARCTSAPVLIAANLSSSARTGPIPISLMRLSAMQARVVKSPDNRSALPAGQSLRADTSSRIARTCSFVGLAGLPAPAPAIHVVGNRMVLPPGTIGVIEEIGAGIAVAIDVARLDAVGAAAAAVCQAEQSGKDNTAVFHGTGLQLDEERRTIASDRAAPKPA